MSQKKSHLFAFSRAHPSYLIGFPLFKGGSITTSMLNMGYKPQRDSLETCLKRKLFAIDGSIRQYDQ